MLGFIKSISMNSNLLEREPLFNAVGIILNESEPSNYLPMILKKGGEG